MKQQEQWTSKLAFILAAAGSAIGLGAIWKFPYVVGTSGGGAFFLLFLLFTFLIGFPLLMAEFVIGRGAQKEAISAYKTIAPKTAWPWLGRMGVTTAFILLSFYSVIGGWIILYLYKSVTGQVFGQDYSALFGRSISESGGVLIAQAVFMLITVLIVSRGVKSGIERANNIMMPALFIMFLILIVRSLTLDGAMKGVEFFLKPDFASITGESILFALGQSFFSLSVGISVMVTYSSYLSKKESLPKSATTIVSLNVVISLLAGLAIFPGVFSLGLKPAEGPGLLFVVLPSVFEQLVFGKVFFVIFLALFLFATLTSAFSMLEIIIAAIIKDDVSKRTKWSWIIGVLIFIVGVPSALSTGALKHVTLIGDRTIFDSLDFLVSNILLPLGSLFIALFVGYRYPKGQLYEEFTSGATIGKKGFALWLLLIRYVTPVVIIIVFLNQLGVWKLFK
ncbi:sodium-dependent transporter [Fictibacillus macauensis ZFHKF-1]|uniref:Transporter n=1 Tax=Fictibacillus macauensis ZFHKF-1 TaxID=1196324 RepID=I8AJT5_9BACL|nr:sodium-dependent transporter [Fictibacillus macauensis]EIT85809.1 sodium-dependent transporter [Fictibacillus macauensis ZFHKF-1]